MELEFPIEFFVLGVPVSAQATNSKRKNAWKERVEHAALQVLPAQYFATSDWVRFEVIVFSEVLNSDLDNAIKPIQDALNGVIYCDDKQIADLRIRKMVLGETEQFENPSAMLIDALNAKEPNVYIRLDVIGQ